MEPSLENGGLGSYEEMHNQDAEQRGIVEWLNSVLPDLNLPTEASEEDIRDCLLDGTVLCCFLNRLIPGSVEMRDGSEPQSASILKFLLAMDRMGLPRFQVLDLEQGSLVEVFQCLQRLREHIHINADGELIHNHARKRWNQPEGKTLVADDHSQGNVQQSIKCGTESRRNLQDSRFQTLLRGSATSVMSTSSESCSKSIDVSQAKKAYHSDILNLKISELTKWNGLDKAPMQLLFSIIDKVLNESFGRKNGDVPHNVACFLRKLIHEIERRVSSQADKTKNQNILTKSREGKYRAKFRALETLAVGAAEETQVVSRHLQQIKAEKIKLGEKKKNDEQHAVRLLREIDQRNDEIMVLKQEREEAKTSYENNCSELEKKFKDTKEDLEKKIEDLECLLKDSKKKVNELEEVSSIQIQNLKKKEVLYHNFIGSQCSLIQGLRMDLDSVKREALRTKNCYRVEFQNFGMNLKELVDAADNYHMVLSENCRLYNEVQDLKGNIRVYCRIRPFLPGQSDNQTTIEYITENGELVVTNPLKQGKDNHRLFKFNKVFDQTATQEEIYKDTQPLIRSVLDGYNVCIFAYGQTGSGKTYTMSGPDISSQKDWGVNYRALHDLFQISQSRRTSILYEVGVQMVEIYNEQVRDLLASDGAQKRLGIWSISQPNGLAVPEASMYPVKSTNDVLELMNIGLMNRAVGATALNERSSRSHSILTVHVRGTDLKSNSLLNGCLHLVDLAGSERVDRSEATGDRLREAQYINKSLSALGDVIFALARKSPHVPYRNSKLTQVLQSSLGGQAKTLMFVQLNPDPESHSESVSTLKFAERVSGVELGAARSNKEGRDLRDLMEQVSSMKEVISRKDEEIVRLRLSKANCTIPKGGTSITRAASDLDSCSEISDRNFEAVSQHSTDEIRINNSCRQSADVTPYMAPNSNGSIDFQRFGHADPVDRLTNKFDNGLSIGTETDGSTCSVEEYSLLLDEANLAESEISEKSHLTSKHPKPPRKQALTSSSMSAPPKTSARVVSSLRKVPAANGLATRPKPKLVKR